MPKVVLIRRLLALAALCLAAANASAATCTSAGGAVNWNTAGTWNCGHVPVAGDAVIVAAGSTVTLDTTTAALASLTVNGTLTAVAANLINLGGNLTNAGTMTIASPITLSGNALTSTWSGGGTWNLVSLDLGSAGSCTGGCKIEFSGSPTIKFTGATPFGTLSATYTINAGLNSTATIISAPSGSQSLPAANIKYPNLTFQGGNTSNSSNGTMTVLGNVSILTGAIFDEDHTTVLNVTGNFTITSGQWIHDASNLATIGGSLSIAGNFNGGGGATSLAGDFSNTGTFNSGGGVFSFNGAGAQAITAGTPTFTKLTINKASGVLTMSSGNVTVSSTLALTAGVVATGANTLIASGANCTTSVTRTSGWVNGNLRVTVPATNPVTCTFHVGDSSNYAPMSFVKTGTNTGTLTGSSTAGDHADTTAGTSGINRNKSVNQYWTLTSGTLASGTPYSLTMSFVAGDVDAGASTGSFIVQEKTAGVWNATTIGSKLATSTQASGLSAFGDFAIGESGSAPAGPDHYELVLPSTGISCTASTVTVNACTDTSSPCSNLYSAASGTTATLATSAGTLGSTSVTFNASGVASTTLSYAAASNGASASVTLSGEATAATNSRQCCPNGVSCSVANSCSTSFSTAGFIVSGSANGAAATLPTQTAGTASAGYYLRAVQTNTTTKACDAALSGAQTVNWGYQCNNPTTCSAGNRMSLTGSATSSIAGNANGSTASSTAVNMTFDGNGNAPFSFTYSDVGLTTLLATKSAGGALLTTLTGSSNALVVKPAGFTLSAIKCTSYTAGNCATTAIATPGNNPAAASGSGTVFMPAGAAFSVTVTAVDSTGSATPNYGHETSAEGVTLAATLVQPTGGNAPTLTNASAFGAFSSGVATGSTFAWPEVGIITLTPSVADSDYLGAGNVTGTVSGNVGRFVPHHFDVAVTPACSSFTYAAQPFSATVTARNLAATTTLNYGNTTSPSFAKTVTLSDASALGVGSLGGNSIAASLFSLGVASTTTPAYTFTNKTTAPKTLAVRAIDGDTVSSQGFVEGSTGLRSGRLHLSNAFGSEKSVLPVTVQAQYWGGNSWVKNTLDSCTIVPAAAVALSGYLDNHGVATASWSTGAPSAITILTGDTVDGVTGVSTFKLTAPSPTKTGSVDLALNLGGSGVDQSCLAAHPASSSASLPWLRSQNGACSALWDRDPSARASFGIYVPELRKTIHAREIF